jgi:hypothetical protein
VVSGCYGFTILLLAILGPAKHHATVGYEKNKGQVKESCAFVERYRWFCLIVLAGLKQRLSAVAAETLAVFCSQIVVPWIKSCLKRLAHYATTEKLAGELHEQTGAEGRIINAD